MKLTILASYKMYANSKEHIQDFRQDIEMQTLCGKYLGFDFGLVTYSGFENDEPYLINIDGGECYIKSGMCKKCIIVLDRIIKNEKKINGKKAENTSVKSRGSK